MNNPRKSVLTTRYRQSNLLQSALVGVCALVPAMLLAGCGMNVGNSVSSAGGGATSFQLTGKVHGGQQPVVGSTIQLYTVVPTV